MWHVVCNFEFRIVTLVKAGEFMGVDLTTDYLGLTLSNPLIVAACPLTREINQIERLEQAGASAVVMFSLFAEQVQCDRLHRTDSASSSTHDSPSDSLPSQAYVVGIDGYLKNIELAKKAVKIPMIGSLNGCEGGDWIQYARLIEQAGADALELNVYFVPTDPAMTGSQVEDRYIDIVSAVRDQVKIPIAVKLSPFFSSLPNMAARLNAEGIDGLVLFNRFLQPDIDINTMEVRPRLTLSTRGELRMPLRWIGILRSQLSLSLAASSGAHCAEDVAKLILAGADVVSMASALLRNGPNHLTKVLDELADYMADENFESMTEMRGFVQRLTETATTAFERANYIKAITSYDDEASV